MGDVVPFLLHELTSAPELWIQKGYLCRVVTREGGDFVDDEVVPLAHFLDSSGPDAVAASVEVDDAGQIIPTIYVRRGGDISEHQLEPHRCTNTARSRIAGSSPRSVAATERSQMYALRLSQRSESSPRSGAGRTCRAAG